MPKSFSTIVFCFILIVGSMGCSQIADHPVHVTATNAKAVSTEPEEYAVYSVLLDELYVRNGADPVIIGQETSLDWLRDSKLREDLNFVREATHKGLAQHVIDNFQADNLHPHLLDNRFKLKVSCVVLSKEEVDAIGQTKDGWNSFLTKYPYQSLITLSRIGFNREMDQALVYTGRESGGKSGRGEFVFLIKEKNVWIIKNRVASWVS